MDDVRAIMDDIGSRRAVIVGFSEGAAMSVLFAATYPERVVQLVLFGGFAVAPTFLSNDLEERIAQRVKAWGTGELMKSVVVSQAANQDAVGQFGKLERLSASPGALRAISLLNAQIDVRSILSTVQVPTLVLHRRTDARVPVEVAAIWRRKFPMPGSSNIRMAITLSGLATRRRCLAISRSLSQGIATVHPPTSSGFSRRFCSPTSSTRRAVQRNWATSAGASYWIVTITSHSR